MKTPFCSWRFLLNLLLVLNIAAIVVVDLWHRDLFSLRWGLECALRWGLECALLLHLALRFPEWLRPWHRG